MGMLYKSKKKLIEEGFTHYGWLWGIPVYVKDIDSEAPIIEAANFIPEWVLTVADQIGFFIEGLLNINNPEYVPVFKIRITGEIK
ncbi:hypothetical protein ACLQ90_11725 [Avibacterium paragallinarum]|uniref:Uncharacterized protein n=1 Tax=Avibacterium paragallinarum TaxID=728 RepID=A0AAE5WG73_AVIPA|nr:hypothetical protein [Avibacterium paragallinarum]MEE3609686.1 hypothetical protein [Avibacterium paragallinarum]MEE3621755.1 hypothetical protein [Avibacterium paragallinarum]MEE3669503.1 hypothetical protein [Avibacterium paragallinarum]MEE3681775.1 hypothetical protein [Avibacterium paragallinarum]MEE4387023.1 hypothetical protein [Avibacterium paragallinarum]